MADKDKAAELTALFNELQLSEFTQSFLDEGITVEGLRSLPPSSLSNMIPEVIVFFAHTRVFSPNFGND